MFQYNDMGELVATNPEEAAKRIRAILGQSGTAQTVADTCGVTHRTVIRWHRKLRETLGDAIGFSLREGRRPGPQKPRKTKRSRKKGGGRRKARDN